MSLALTATCRTHVGHVRANNEDSAYAGTRLVAVADGVGGAAAGEVASAAVIDALRPLDAVDPGYDLIGRLHQAINDGNHAIAAQAAADPALAGMGTTLTAVLLGDRRFGLVNVGDSRTYLVRDGEVRQITRDDSFVQLLIDEGHITEEEAEHHPQRSVVLQALTGQEIVEPALSVHEAQPDDRFLLCSDGLSDLVPFELIERTLRSEERESCADCLVGLALAAGGRDNITVIVADVVEVQTGQNRNERSAANLAMPISQSRSSSAG
jgi:protein phosphatase